MAGASMLLCSVTIHCLLLLVTAQPYISTPHFSLGNGGVYVGTGSGPKTGSQPQIIGYQFVPDEQENFRLPLSTYQLPRSFLESLQGIISRQSLLPKQGAGYAQQQPSTGYHQPVNNYPPKPSGYSPHTSSGGSGVSSGYGPKKPTGYGKRHKKKKVKKEKIYVPVPIKKARKKKSKKKTLSVSKGFYVAGGSQLFGKFKSLKSCQKACDKTASCFGGDYDKWTRRCFMHTNATSCGIMQPSKSLSHFKKVPCSTSSLGLDFARITLGANLDHGILQKGIKDIQTCIKKCSQAGGGIPAMFTSTAVATPTAVASHILNSPQLCFGIDYDFANHKCYFHTQAIILQTDVDVDPAGLDNADVVAIRGINGGIVCFGSDIEGFTGETQPRTPTNLRSNPSVVNVIMCPKPYVA